MIEALEAAFIGIVISYRLPVFCHGLLTSIHLCENRNQVMSGFSAFAESLFERRHMAHFVIGLMTLLVYLGCQLVSLLQTSNRTTLNLRS